MKLSDLEHLREHDEIRFKEETLPNGEIVTIVSYMVANPKLWKIPLALECRGITFDIVGNCISRPFVKFFNINENDTVQLADLTNKKVKQVTDKRDGSMITPALVDGVVYLKTKKSFYSEVAINATQSASANFMEYCKEQLLNDWTPIFEYTDPKSAVVIDYGSKPNFVLLSVRHNITGEMKQRSLMLMEAARYGIECIQSYENESLEYYVNHCEDPQTVNIEGYVIQFEDDTQVKIKTEWYNRNHHIRTDLRERDIADMVIDETIDDVKSFASIEGYDISVIEAIEQRVADELTGIIHRVKELSNSDPELSVKDYALKYKDHELFGMAISHRKGADIDPIKHWTRTYRENYKLSTIYSNFIEKD